MKKILKISMFLVVIFFTFHHIGNASGSNDFQTKKPMTVEEVYEAEGYTNFKVATKEFEKKFNSKINLPQKIPFKIEYKYAKIDKKNSKVTFEYLGENFKGNQLKIVASLNDLGKFKGGYNYYTKNGTEVYIRHNPNPHQSTMLSFKKDDLQYYLILFYQNKDLEKEKIIEIANSFDI
ncbi:hypothetical protein RCG19_13020 [Neobacillus sp. OS1-2]|uniref:hypothetical protein n=1 Tax=Neobacillus sp. OS1-2 TaxID=3070680 RepID=UPI0027E0A294|nr:hypothetical protein [Neobacillus sp. OS1-2]WML38147.1 hypothetical protein RCG19_13020 [Neobacillus sp. OS1-2]